jgi:hypothetical protein
LISNSKKFGINVKEAQVLFESARTQKDIDYQLALASLKKSIDTVKTAVSEFRPKLVAKINLDRVEKGKWIETEILLTNQGKALAKDIHVNILGDVSIEGNTKIEAIRGGGGEVKLIVKMKLETPGEVPILIKMTSTRIMDGMTFEDESNYHVFVLEPKLEAPKAAVAKSTFELLKSPTDTKCSICMGKVKTGIEIIKCSCGKDYHAMCGRRFGKCAGCGIEFIEKMDEKIARDDEIEELTTSSVPPKPEPTPLTPIPAETTSAEDKKDEPKAEPPKVAKKKVALKF